MLRTLKDLFESLTAAPADASAQPSEHDLQLCTAVLLVEVMRSDAEMGDHERRSVLESLRERFDLAEDEVARLVELAERTSRDATDFFAFTATLNARLDEAGKARILEHMWRVAYADGRLTAHEQHVMRKLADLLYVGHGPYVGAKMRAAASAGASSSPPVPPA